jgi:hypothetical protein
MNGKKRPNSITSSATRDFVTAAWRAQKKAPWDFLHSYLYARWPYLYIAFARGDHPLAKVLTAFMQACQRIIRQDKLEAIPRPSPTQATATSADIYHGKVMLKEHAQELVLVNEPINIHDLEQVVPYVRARAIIQQNPDHILLVKCPAGWQGMTPACPSMCAW